MDDRGEALFAHGRQANVVGLGDERLELAGAYGDLLVVELLGLDQGRIDQLGVAFLVYKRGGQRLVDHLANLARERASLAAQ